MSNQPSTLREEHIVLTANLSLSGKNLKHHWASHILIVGKIICQLMWNKHAKTASKFKDALKINIKLLMIHGS